MMKYVFLLMLVAIPFLSIGQKIQVPSPVSATFSKLFPDIKKVKWEKEGSVYEAVFKSSGNTMSVEIDSLGVWISSNQDVKKADLPEAITNSINSLFAKSKIIEVEKGEAANVGQHYQVELKSEGKKYKLIYTLDGQLISKTLD